MKKNIKTKTHNLYKIIFILVVFLGIGYAFLEANLNINGDVTVEAPELNSYIQGVNVTSGSTSGTPTIIGNDKKEVDPGVLKQFNIISNLCNREDVTTIVNAGDADREGEVIIRLITENALKSEKDLRRLWLPDQTNETINEALKEIVNASFFIIYLRIGVAER